MLMALRRYPWREGAKCKATIQDEGFMYGVEVSGRIEKGQTCPPKIYRVQNGSDFGFPSYADMNLGNYSADGKDGATVGALLQAAREEFEDPDLHIDVCWEDGSRHVQRRGRPADSGARGACLPGQVPKWVLVGSGPNDHEALLSALLDSPALRKTS